MVIANHHLGSTVNMNNKKKTTKGRKKIEIKKIEEANSRQVTFSKRRTGLFKKASELCILTGAQVAILVSSPGGRVFAFGHPKVETVVDRYLNNNNNDDNNNTSSSYNNHYSSPPPLPAQEFNAHYTEVSRELEAEKKRRDQMIVPSTSSSLPWFERPTEGMDVGELDLFLWSLLELRRKVLTRADELMMINRSQQSSAAAAGPNVLFDQMRWKNYVNGGQMAAGHVPTNGAGGFAFQHHGIGGSAGDQILPQY